MTRCLLVFSVTLGIGPLAYAHKSEAHREEMKRHLRVVHEACQQDVEKFCGDVRKGRGRVMKCMKKHKEELSEPCKAEMSKMKELRQKGK